VGEKQLRGMAITLAISLGSVAAVLVALRVALGSGAADVAVKIGNAVWGKDGFTDALGSYLEPLFRPVASEDEKAVILRRQAFQADISNGKSVKDAFASAGIAIGAGGDITDTAKGKRQLLLGRMVQAAAFNSQNTQRLNRGLPVIPASARSMVFGFNVRSLEEAMAIRNVPLASFGNLKSRESKLAASVQLRQLNTGELSSILGSDSLDNALTLRRLSLPVAN